MNYKTDFITVNGINYQCQFVYHERQPQVDSGSMTGPEIPAEVEDLTVYLRDPVSNEMHQIEDALQAYVLDRIEEAILDYYGSI